MEQERDYMVKRVKQFLNGCLEDHFDVLPERAQKLIIEIDALNNQRIKVEKGYNSFGEFRKFYVDASRFAMEAVERYLKEADQKYVIYFGEAIFTVYLEAA